MKKLIAVLSVFTLLVPALFAEVTVSGSVGAGATLAKGSNVRTDPIQSGFYLNGDFELEGVDEEDKFGGKVRLNGELSSAVTYNSSIDPSAPTNTGGTSSSGIYDYDWDTSNPLNNPPTTNFALYASAWWKPVYFMKLQFGHIDDYAKTEIVGWGYHANDAENYVIWPKNNYAGDYFADSAGFYSGTGSEWIGLSLSLTPIYGLELNAVVPFFGKGFEILDAGAGGVIAQNFLAKDVYLYTHAQIAYTLYGVGRLSFTYAGGGGGKLRFVDYHDPDTFIQYNPVDDGVLFELMNVTASSLYASFLLSAFEEKGFIINLGFAYTMPVSDIFYNYQETQNIKISYNSPMEVGLGFSFGSSKFGIKTRMAASFGGKAEREGSAVLEEPLMLGLGILPHISVGSFTFYLNAGVSYRFEEQYMDSTDNFAVKKILNSAALGWYANPYMTFSFGSGIFFAGFQIGSDGLKYTGTNKDNVVSKIDNLDTYPGQTIIEWAVPMGIQFSF